MRRLDQIAFLLYPRWWRDRYGAEFAALLEDARPGFVGTLDICKAALSLRLSNVPGKQSILAGALAGILAAATTAFLISPTYISKAQLVFGPTNATADNLQQWTECSVIFAAQQMMHPKSR